MCVVSKLKVMHIIPTLADCSITRIVLHIAQHLGQQDYEWSVVSTEPSGAMEAIYEENGVKVFFLPGPDHFSRAMQLKRMLSSESVDILHTHTPKTTVITWIARLLNKQYTKCLYTKHLFGSNYRKLEWVYKFVEIISLYQTDYLAPVSQTMGNELLNYPGINSNWLSPVQNGIDCNYFYQPQERDACRVELDLSSENFVFFFSGRLEPMKQLFSLLDSFSTLSKEYPLARLVIAGIGSLGDELKSYAHDLGLDNKVIWCGWRTDVPRLLAAADVYIQPSLNEGLPLSVIEAMAAEKPVISTAVGGIYEIVEPDVDGIVIPPDDVKKLTQAMKDIISDPEERLKMAHLARKKALAHFDFSRMTKEYGLLYQQLVGKK